MTVRPAAILLLVATFASRLPGCAADPTQGYSARSVYTDDVATVAVPIFENDTYHRGVEYELTDALIKEIHARTPYRVVSQARADTVLLGRVDAVELERLSKSRLTGLAEEVIVAVTIDFVWKDLRTDERLVERRQFTGTGLFVPSRPTGEPIELGQFNAVEQLASDIVDEMRSNW